jgi:hypothetical protein
MLRPAGERPAPFWVSPDLLGSAAATEPGPGVFDATSPAAAAVWITVAAVPADDPLVAEADAETTGLAAVPGCEVAAEAVAGSEPGAEAGVPDKAAVEAPPAATPEMDPTAEAPCAPAAAPADA